MLRIINEEWEEFKKILPIKVICIKSKFPKFEKGKIYQCEYCYRGDYHILVCDSKDHYDFFSMYRQNWVEENRQFQNYFTTIKKYREDRLGLILE